MFKTARRQFIANETIEPTSFSGFNQFWDDPTGSSAWNAGVGIDQRIDGQVLFGAEVLNRELRVPAFVSSSPDFYEWRDNAGRFYFSRTISAANTPVPESRWSFVLSSECYYDELQRPEDLAVDGIVVLHTSTCPLKLSAFSPSGLTVNVAANYVRRKGVLQLFPGFDRVVVAEEFWTGDLSIDIRLPNRRGKISIGVDNISDQRSRIIDSNDVTMHVPPRNVWFAKISIAI
jgi:hypothetical protein